MQFPTMEQDITSTRCIPRTASPSAAVKATVVTTMICPSDITAQLYTAGTTSYAISSYGGNAGNGPDALINSINGIFFGKSHVRILDVTDGTSNTLLFGERSHVDLGGYAMQQWGRWVYSSDRRDVLMVTGAPLNYDTILPPNSTTERVGAFWQTLHP